MTLMRGLVVAAIILTGFGPAFAEDAAGKWLGVVKSPDGDIPLTLTITKADDGKLTAIAESPTQAPGMQIPTENVASDGAKLSFDVAMAAGSYASTWDEAKKIWAGTWTQNGVAMPLDLSRAP